LWSAAWCDGVAQQRGVVARQRCHDQHGGLALELVQRGRVVGEALEAAQLAERLVDLDPLMDGDHGAPSTSTVRMPNSGFS
jgi:hypothetical protein